MRATSASRPNPRLLLLARLFAVAGLFWMLYAAAGCRPSLEGTIRVDELVPEGAEGRERLLDTQARLGIAFEVVGWPVHYQAIWGSIRANAPGMAAARAYVPALLDELSRYTPALVQVAGLKAIVLCDGLKVGRQARAAVPIFDDGKLYVDVDDSSEEYRRRVFHHELFHMVDHGDDGVLERDPAWEAFNRAGFRYGSGGSSMQDDPASGVFDDALEGFLTRYAMSGVEEDKAEIFSYLMVAPGRVDARADRDQVLFDKVSRIRDVAAGYGVGL